VDDIGKESGVLREFVEMPTGTGWESKAAVCSTARITAFLPQWRAMVLAFQVGER